MTLAAELPQEEYRDQLLNVVREHSDEDLSFDTLLTFANREIGVSDLQLRQTLWHLILSGQVELTRTRRIKLPSVKAER